MGSPLKYNKIAFTADTSNQVASVAKARVYLLIQNTGARDVFIGFDEAVTTDFREFLRLDPGGSYEPENPPRGSINVRTRNNDTELVILEGER